MHSTIPSGITEALSEKFDVKFANGNIIMSMSGNVEVYNISGTLIASAEEVKKLSLVSLNKGVYLVRCHAGKNIRTLKIIK